MSHFSTRQCSASHDKGVTRPSLGFSLAGTIPRFVSNLAYLGSFGMASWASHEFERTRGMVTANMERNVSRHHTELVCLSIISYIRARGGATGYTKAFGDGPRNFEPWPSDEELRRRPQLRTTPELTAPSPNYNTTPTGGHLSSRQI
ncbi:transposable element Tcb1 transposase [Trichonephila clavipes]|uniref:Transposable element Tcb1 transposase n=1 Tax=Trichonephila clavipes TaxID=2585209 RepID=A0A8X6R486_TRICX|nr:transposable element Tcb1 transposase [Trichonephila clavipes]